MGGSGSSVTMTLSVQTIVRRCPLIHWWGEPQLIQLAYMQDALMNTQCTCMFNCLCCIVSVRNLFDQLNINRVHGHTTVAIVNTLFILGFFCSVFMDMYTVQLIIEVCLFAGDWSHWMHEYVHVALRQSEICFKSLIKYQQRSAWAYHSGHSTCKCII